MIFISGAGSISVPSTIFVSKPTLTSEDNKVSGENFQWLAADVGVAHPKRRCIMGVMGGNFNGGSHSLLVGGAPATYRVQNGGYFNILDIELPTGPTADFQINVGTGGMSRAAIHYGIFYPATSGVLAGDTASATGLTNAVINNLGITAGGLAVFFGGQQGVLGTFTGTWNVVDSAVEHIDAQAEATDSYAFYTVDCTETNSTRDFTFAASASGTKRICGVTYYAP